MSHAIIQVDQMKFTDRARTHPRTYSVDDSYMAYSAHVELFFSKMLRYYLLSVITNGLKRCQHQFVSLPTKSSNSNHSLRSKLTIHSEVLEALHNNKPVVALESTIITHGMPFPQNLKAVKSLNKIIRSKGVVPATVAILNGRIHVGLTESKLENLANIGLSAVKTSRRDIPAVLSKNLVGATTVSGTMVAAALAGISIFVTGGIGGVHHGADKSFDVSADLTELGRTPVAVVCAGVKSILDIGSTLEYLETCGVTVATVGDTLQFPAFFTSDSGFKAPYNVRTAKEAAMMIDCSLEMEMKCGMVFGVPIPQSHSLMGAKINVTIQTALLEAKKKNIVGKDITPFVLKQIDHLTEGKSVEANIALVQNNALVGSEIAIELCKLRESRRQMFSRTNEDSNIKSSKYRPVVIGGSNVDFAAKTSKDIMFGNVTNSGEIRQSFGGVARNIAECIARIGQFQPVLITCVGADDLGEMLLKHLSDVGVSTFGVQVNKKRSTATYSVVLNSKGEVIIGIGDMDIHKSITTSLIDNFEETIRNAPVVIIDGNLEENVIKHCIEICSQHSTPVVFEPTCVMKAAKPFKDDSWQQLTLTTPNIDELRTMSALAANGNQQTLFAQGDPSKGDINSVQVNERSIDEVLKECIQLCKPLMRHIPMVVVTMGELGVFVCRDVPLNLPLMHDGKFLGVRKKSRDDLFYAAYFPPCKNDRNEVEVVSVTGAGDSFSGGFVSSALSGMSTEICVKCGLMAAWYSVQGSLAVSPSLNSECFTQSRIQSWATWEAVPIDINDVHCNSLRK
ncbi:pseudouridine-metabolizing bifunctional protein C1861.05-like isoform X1 [Xenia sp. Carnegie-2017]|uniref:pseudouridine-metabolizing bifunctional protein C1861.05-like isoform X1 n=1 Tax=Xenia sp. Carnegie-2017 TaxID=2897299 RepID=UPI001F037E73|nr:pseudouridine-metabolizing bifunctional protein C1861.05-like isoform X1 [Xenia sp. Carnegie-2017]XP_046865066.1 pseudouridine-metabolizing bifunctional protein C1861.05-like isoform X1 [Xenia sp. Carnegie-2017]XP_046865067.1 pseudouridine-metabolizing bifunctional protein C1861.05-like isoform X1 [Xenia sp. Carnegie-2017]